MSHETTSNRNWLSVVVALSSPSLLGDDISGDRLGLSQRVVAGAIGMSVPMVSRYEAGISIPRGEVLARYLQVLALLAAESNSPTEMHDAAGGRRRAGAARECRHDEA